MIDDAVGPDTPEPGPWVVPAPSLDADGRPMRRRSTYPASRLGSDTVPPADAAAPPEGEVPAAHPSPASRPRTESIPSTPTAEKPMEPPSGRTTAQRVRGWAETVAVFAVGLVLALVVRAFLLQAFSIPSPSMVPTLEGGDRVVVWKPSDTIDDLDRGDVIVFKRPNVAECPFAADDPADLIKRIIGLPGEEISSPDGEVLVDGEVIDESYLPSGTRTDMAEPITVPDGEVLMLGDNRGASKDGRCFGPITEDAIVGRATARVWPPGRIGGL